MTRAGARWATPHRSAAALATPWRCHAPGRGPSGHFSPRDRRPRKIWVGKSADGYSDVTGKALGLFGRPWTPHVGQEWKVRALPLSVVRVHAGDLPANAICSQRKRA